VPIHQFQLDYCQDQGAGVLEAPTPVQALPVAGPLLAVVVPGGAQAVEQGAK